jgi:hypothetical protein
MFVNQKTIWFDILTSPIKEKRGGGGGGEEEKSPTNNTHIFNVFVLKLVLFDDMIIMKPEGSQSKLHWCSICDPPKSYCCWMMKSEKHVSLAQQNGFDLAFLHSVLRLIKRHRQHYGIQKEPCTRF